MNWEYKEGDPGEILNIARFQTTSGFFAIPLLSQLEEEKNYYCERRNELSLWRPVALPNHHIHLCLCKLRYKVLALLSSDIYILSGKKMTVLYPMSHILIHQNSWQVDNRLYRAGILCVLLLHLPPWVWQVRGGRTSSKSISVFKAGSDPKGIFILTFIFQNCVWKGYPAYSDAAVLWNVQELTANLWIGNNRNKPTQINVKIK